MPPPPDIRAVIFDLGNTLWFDARSPDMAAIYRQQAARVRPLLEEWGGSSDEVGASTRGASGTVASETAPPNVLSDDPAGARDDASTRGALAPPQSPDPAQPPFLDRLLEQIWSAYMTAVDVEQQRGRHREPSLPFIIRGALAANGIDITEAQAEQWWRAAWIPVSAFGVQLYPDVLDVLRELHARGIKIAVNTNRPCTGDMLRPDLESIGIGDYIDVAVCSGDTGYTKPHPSTFNLCLEQLALAPNQTVMVGDLCQNDCTGAKSLGITTVLKLNGRYDAPPCPDADYTIHDLGELLHLPLFDPTHHNDEPESPTPHEDNNADRY